MSAIGGKADIERGHFLKMGCRQLRQPSNRVGEAHWVGQLGAQAPTIAMGSTAANELEQTVQRTMYEQLLNTLQQFPCWCEGKSDYWDRHRTD
jgi:hypothetical protein